MTCDELHAFVRTLPRYSFPFDPTILPTDGIYFLFELGEEGHRGARIVRVGTHTGIGQLRSRLRQHFEHENKDRSVFRKNIGRALLSRDRDPYLPLWELDLTSRAARELHGAKIDRTKQRHVEEAVTKHLRTHMSFAVIPIQEAAQRLKLESRLISTISLCEECQPSRNWLGNFSPKDKIRESGLWIVNELYKDPLSPDDREVLLRAVL